MRFLDFVVVLLGLLFRSLGLALAEPDHTLHNKHNKYVSFLEKKINLNHWEAYKSHLTKLFTIGDWVDAQRTMKDWKPLYDVPCTDVPKYIGHHCAVSTATQGYAWAWNPHNISSSSHSEHSEHSEHGAQSHHHHLHSHHWRNWDVEGMCRVMNGRNLMLIGDSINEEFYSTLAASLLSEFFVQDREDMEYLHYDLARLKEEEVKSRQRSISACDTLCVRDSWMCSEEIHIPCAPEEGLPSFKLSFMWSDTLDHNVVELESGLQKGRSVVDVVKDRNASVIVLNTGAHIRDRTTDMAKESVRLLLQDFREKLDMHRISLIYRSTVPGHESCVESAKDPPLSMNMPITKIDSPSFHSNKGLYEQFQWYKFKDLNNYVRDLTQGPNATYPEVLYMDVYSSTLHRADNHVGWLDDCLHYCQPGPIDEWSVFLYNALLGAEALAEMGEMGKIEEVASADDGLEGKTENGSEVDKGADRERKGKRKRRLKHKIKLSRRNKLRTRQTPEGAEGKCVFAIGSSAVYLVQNYTRHVLPDYDAFINLKCSQSPPGRAGQLLEDRVLHGIPVSSPVIVKEDGVPTFDAPLWSAGL